MNLTTNISEVELVYRSKVKASDRPTVKQSSDLYRLFLSHWNMDKIELVEQMKLILLNRGNGVLGIMDISSGSSTGTVIDLKMILAAAIKTNSVGFCICHNHPSGYLKPSGADIELTGRLAQAAKLIDLRLLDHLIISKEGYFSFADEGLI